MTPPDLTPEYVYLTTTYHYPPGNPFARPLLAVTHWVPASIYEALIV